MDKYLHEFTHFLIKMHLQRQYDIINESILLILHYGLDRLLLNLPFILDLHLSNQVLFSLMICLDIHKMLLIGKKWHTNFFTLLQSNLIYSICNRVYLIFSSLSLQWLGLMSFYHCIFSLHILSLNYCHFQNICSVLQIIDF